MPTILSASSTLTSRFQTTVPEAVRKALNLDKSDKICYQIGSNGLVTLTKMAAQEEDPALSGFLSFLENDIRNNPGNIKSFSLESIRQAEALIAGVEIDLDEPL